MNTNTLETTCIFRGAYYLCVGGRLIEIRIRNKGRQIGCFLFSGSKLAKYDKDYTNGHASVNPLQFRESLNWLRDALFEKLRANDEGRYGNDRKRKNRRYKNQY